MFKLNKYKNIFYLILTFGSVLRVRNNLTFFLIFVGLIKRGFKYPYYLLLTVMIKTRVTKGLTWGL